MGNDYVKDILLSQKNEITEYHIYTKLSQVIKSEKNAALLKKIGLDEKRHYEFWKKQSGKDVRPSQIKIFFFYWISRLFGITFGIKLLERGEESAQVSYSKLVEEIPGVEAIIHDEDNHERTLIDMLDEEKLKYAGSIVLGLNDALVELTGTLAGLTFALRNTRLIALAGLITGIAASFSMAASEYLSKKQETDGEEGAEPFKSSVYTGIAYIVTVILLILPYLTIADYFYALLVTLAIAVFIIFIFNYYISVAKDLPFRRRFLEMFAISMGVALFSFGVGWVIRIFLGVEV